MAYSELIKDFNRVRDYMRQFYVYGFRSRSEFTKQSGRSYDNERRRVESWLGEYMSFAQTTNGKNVFISVDSREVPSNPLYKAFKAKSFTKGDIVFHFYVLDYLADGTPRTIKEIMEAFCAEYLAVFPEPFSMDESSLRKKLAEYERLGILRLEKRGREKLYARSQDNINLATWQQAIAFFAEADPLGVIGSFFFSRLESVPDYFSFKHDYILFAIDSQLLLQLVTAITEKRGIEVVLLKGARHYVCPMRIYRSVQTGRQYLCSYDYKCKQPFFFRLDKIQEIKISGVEKNYAKYEDFYKHLKDYLWGVSTGVEYSLDHVEVVLRVKEDEPHILERLEREKRCGQVAPYGDGLYRFTADVYDDRELVPWLRTFIGRIVSLKSSNPYFVKSFQADLKAMQELYGGDELAV